MRRPSQNFAIDIAIAVTFVLLIATGFLMKYVIPPGSGRALTVLTMNRHEWGEIHFWISVTMILLIALHLLLHTKWITTMVKGKNPLLRRKRAAAGIIVGIVMLFVVLLPFLLPVQRTDAGQGEGSSSERVEAPSHDGEEARQMRIRGER
jgi:glucan phosphoethanolaminetransferase (alkaline phosphatase superfamily)